MRCPGGGGGTRRSSQDQHSCSPQHSGMPGRGGHRRVKKHSLQCFPQGIFQSTLLSCSRGGSGPTGRPGWAQPPEPEPPAVARPCQSPREALQGPLCVLAGLQHLHVAVGLQACRLQLFRMAPSCFPGPTSNVWGNAVPFLRSHMAARPLPLHRRPPAAPAASGCVWDACICSHRRPSTDTSGFLTSIALTLAPRWGSTAAP